MKFRRRRSVQEAAVELTPLIDVVFLLLIFFMVSTRFIDESNVTLVLPEADAESSPFPDEQVAEVTISKDGSYALNGQVIVNEDKPTLIRAIHEQFPDHLPESLIIRADAFASHQSVVTAMDAAGELGISRVRIATMQPEESQ